MLAAIAVGIALSRLSTSSTDRAPLRATQSDPSPRTFTATLAIASAWVVLTVAPLLLLATLDVPQRLEPLYVFFTKAAYVTFGGAYAVLAYVNQAAVESFGWLTAAQAVDGFALAETTPGPLIMVLQFVGFMAGWHDAGPWSPPVAAVAAALLTTYATFLPSFFFILLGAPYVERLRGIRWLDAALAAVTAAVVGVILNLGVVFATAVFWAQGATNIPALVLALIAALALWRKVNVVWVVLGGGAVGLLAQATGWI
ncbi:MAG: chromate transporter [Gammaproteobacteria bacterium]|nr:chromate transporter [Gammaproteobacteria bacterium]